MQFLFMNEKRSRKKQSSDYWRKCLARHWLYYIAWSKIGNNSIIAAGSVVNCDVPET